MPDNVERINELGGYVNQQRAMELLGITSKGWLSELVGSGAINAKRWDERTLLYEKRSIQRYLARRKKADEAPRG